MDSPSSPGPVPTRLSRATVSWAALYAAITLDVAQVFALDYSDGFTDPVLAGTAIIAFAGELYLFSVALRRITSSVAYGLLGFGTAAVAAISIGWLGEPLTLVKGLALLAVVAGAGLLSTEASKPAV